MTGLSPTALIIIKLIDCFLEIKCESCYPCTLGEGSLVIILEHKRRPAAIKMKENQRKLYVSLVGPYAAKMLPHKNP